MVGYKTIGDNCSTLVRKQLGTIVLHWIQSDWGQSLYSKTQKFNVDAALVMYGKCDRLCICSIALITKVTKGSYMASPRVLILRAPGTNCDAETAFAFESVGAKVCSVHVNRLIDDPGLGSDYQILCFPGGFSYGDDIAAGRILAQRLQVHLRDLVEEFRGEDRLVLGICNGFQVMMRLGIFFPGEESRPPATLALNRQARFEDRWVHLVNANSNSVFLRGITSMYLPMAHAEGRFTMSSPEAAKKLLEAQQLGLRYSDELQQACDDILPFPHNPNGAEMNVAGISDPSGRVFGLMPHPERHLDPTNHPFWTRRDTQPEHGEGRVIFSNAVEYFA